MLPLFQIQNGRVERRRGEGGVSAGPGAAQPEPGVHVPAPILGPRAQVRYLNIFEHPFCFLTFPFTLNFPLLLHFHM
jgi:hypothetical protein